MPKYKVTRTVEIELEPKMHYLEAADRDECLTAAESGYHIGNLSGSIWKSFDENGHPWYDLDDAVIPAKAFVIAEYSIGDDQGLRMEEVMR